MNCRTTVIVGYRDITRLTRSKEGDGEIRQAIGLVVVERTDVADLRPVCIEGVNDHVETFKIPGCSLVSRVGGGGGGGHGGVFRVGGGGDLHDLNIEYVWFGVKG